MNIKRPLLLIIFIMLSSCAAPGPVKEKAQNILSGACYNLFVDNGVGSYQMCTHQFTQHCVFTLAMDKSDRASQVCSFARGSELLDEFCLVGCSPTNAQVEALAVKRCEEFKAKSAIKNDAPCKIFAINNDIVWDDKAKDAKFQ